MFCCTKPSAEVAAAKAAGAEKMIVASIRNAPTTLAAHSGTIRCEYDVMNSLLQFLRETLVPQNGKRVETAFVPVEADPRQRLKVRQILNFGRSIPDFIVAGLPIKATDRGIKVQ